MFTFKLSRIHRPPCPMGPNTFNTVLPVISPGCRSDVGSYNKITIILILFFDPLDQLLFQYTYRIYSKKSHPE